MYSNAELLRVAQETFAGAKIIEMLKQNVREDGARSTGTQGKQKLIDRIVKENLNGNKGLAMAHKQEDGRYIFTNGQILFFSDTNAGYPESEIPFNALNLIKNLNLSDSATIDKAEVVKFCKLNGLRRGGIKKAPYILKTDNGQYIGFNPFYLIDFVDYTGNEKILCDTPIHPAKGIEDDSIVLPVNIKHLAMDAEKYDKWREENL